MLKFFVFTSCSETTHLASFSFSDSCFSAAQIGKISLLALTVATLDNHLVLHARCNCWPFFFIVVWCIARQADRNGETVKHFHNCIKVLSQFRTPYCSNLWQYSNRPRRGGAHDNAQIPYLQCSLPILRHKIKSALWPITMQPFVAIATCRNTCFPQIVYFNTRRNHNLAFRI